MIMKRLHNFLSIVLVGAVCIIAVPAKGFNSDPLTFFKSTENMQQLESYRLHQNLTGDFEFRQDLQNEAEMKGEYWFKINTDVFSRAPYESDLYSFIRGQALVYAGGDNRPFGRLKVNLRAEVIRLSGDGIYARLGAFNLTADDVSDNEKEDYLAFKTGLEEQLETVRNQWFYFPEDILEASNTEALPASLQSTLDRDALREDLKEKGLKATYQDTLNSLAQKQLSGAEADTVQTVINDFFNTDFFTERTVVAGPQKGFTNYTLSKRRLSRFAVSAARTMGEKVTESDKKELGGLLNKFYLSAMTHEDETYNIFDFFRLKLILENIGPFSQFSVYYSYKVSSIDELSAVTAPDEFTSYETLQLPFLPVRPEDRFCGWEEDDCLDPDACGACSEEEGIKQ